MMAHMNPIPRRSQVKGDDSNDRKDDSNDNDHDDDERTRTTSSRMKSLPRR